jgi:hypothetical protein
MSVENEIKIGQCIKKKDWTNADSLVASLSVNFKNQLEFDFDDFSEMAFIIVEYPEKSKLFFRLETILAAQLFVKAVSLSTELDDICILKENSEKPQETS